MGNSVLDVGLQRNYLNKKYIESGNQIKYAN